MIKVTIECNSFITSTRIYDEEYEVIHTNTPKAYDFDDVIEGYNGGDERIVLVPARIIQSQTERYQSGSFWWTRVPYDIEQHYATMLAVYVENDE